MSKRRMTGKLHLIDLAGSERLDKSGATGQALKEAIHINKSLSALGDVIAARANKSGHCPYRNSALTHVLEDSLAGDSKTLMLSQISPATDNAQVCVFKAGICDCAWILSLNAYLIFSI